MRRSMPAHRARGSSLIEVMISMVILAIGILGVLQMSAIASQQNKVAARQTAGAFIGRDLVAAVDRMPYSHPAFAGACGATTTVTIYDRATNTLNIEWANALPVLSETPAILLADQKAGALGGIEKVWWEITCDEEVAGGYVFGRNVHIVVQTKLPGGGTRDMHFWTEKYNPSRLAYGDPKNFQEI